MPPCLLTNFEMQKYYQNQFKFKGVYSQKKSIGTHSIALHATGNNVTYFVSFDVEHNPEEIKTFISNKNIIKNIFRTLVYNSIM